MSTVDERRTDNGRAAPSESDHDPENEARHRWARHLSNNVFAQVERAAYVVVGVLLSVTAAIALAGAAVVLWHGLWDWSGGTGRVVEIVDRLLFVLMLIEILHTVRASTRTQGLTAEPFLIVGLIASIRRVLVITLQISHSGSGGSATLESSQQFRASMIELGVLGGLILVMIISIYLLHRSGAHSSATGE
jgi:uncharacterized membrane protein (DUF373 family)